MVNRSPSWARRRRMSVRRWFLPAATARLRAEEGLSSSQDSLLAVQRPLRRGALGHPLQDPRYRPWPSPFRHRFGSPLVRLATGNLTTLARSSLPLQTGQLLAPFQGLRCSASTAGCRPTPGAVLPGTLASPRTRLALAGCPELVARVVAVDHPLSGSSSCCR
jgi:hypothetical protein